MCALLCVHYCMYNVAAVPIARVLCNHPEHTEMFQEHNMIAFAVVRLLCVCVCVCVCVLIYTGTILCHNPFVSVFVLPMV